MPDRRKTGGFCWRFFERRGLVCASPDVTMENGADTVLIEGIVHEVLAGKVHDYRLFVNCDFGVK